MTVINFVRLTRPRHQTRWKNRLVRKQLDWWQARLFKIARFHPAGPGVLIENSHTNTTLPDPALIRNTDNEGSRYLDGQSGIKTDSLNN